MHFAFTSPIISALKRMTFSSVIDIVLVAFVVYQLLMIVKGRRAAHILTGLLMLAVVYVTSNMFGLELLSTLLARIAPYLPFVLIVVFQSEIRRLLSRLGRRRLFSLDSRLQRREFTEEIVLAIVRLSQTKTGALIVVERDIGLRTFIESGVVMDAALSRDLLLSIFQTGSALHDGAVIVQRDKIAAAACFLPLTVKPVAERKLGTRHRAAIGITEETDCLSLVVSEETGRISVAAFGEIEFDVNVKRLEERIQEHLVQRRWSQNYRGLKLPVEESMAHQHGIDE